MVNPKVSIILPNYNHALFLKQRLESIYNQTFQDFEVILLDDASTDQSLSILNDYNGNSKTKHLIVNTQNSGSPFKQWQKGIELAQGKYIWIAESDDYCELTFLEKMISYFELHPSLGLGYCQTFDVDKDGKEILHRIDYTKEFQSNIWESNFKMNGSKFVTDYLVIKNVIPNASAVLFKRDLIKKDFFLNSLLNMKMCGDWFFWIQLCLQTEVGFFAAELNYFRNHQSVSRNHSNPKIKKRRLLEESILRSYLYKRNINCFSAEQKLYNQWFKLHKLSSIISTSFYEINISKKSIFALVTKLIKFKLRKK